MVFKYRDSKRNVEDVARRARFSGSSFDSYILDEFQTYKPKEGENTVRVLPRTWDDEEKWGTGWEIVIRVHYSVGPDAGTYLCLAMKDEECPICSARLEMDEEEAKELRVGQRLVCWVIDRNNEKGGPQVWAMPPKLFREINARSVNKKTNAPILIDHDENGHDFTFNREGTDKRSAYAQVDIEREPSPVSNDERQQARWLKHIEDNPLPEVLRFYEADYLEKVLTGRASRKSEEDEEQDQQPVRRARLAKEADDEEEEKPAARARRAAVIEDEDDEPKPRSRTSTRFRSELEDEEEGKEAAEFKRNGGGRKNELDDEELPFDDDEPTKKSPVAQAKSKLERLRR